MRQCVWVDCENKHWNLVNIESYSISGSMLSIRTVGNQHERIVSYPSADDAHEAIVELDRLMGVPQDEPEFVELEGHGPEWDEAVRRNKGGCIDSGGVGGD